MSQYTKTTNFASKDNLSPGNPLKIVKGTEIDTEFNNIQTAVATKTDNSAANITGGSITGITDLAVADGGTGASTATAALNNLLPTQTGNANKYLQTDGTNATWDAVSLSTADITGTLPVANGGTGVTSSTGTGSVVLSNSPTLVTPALGTPASGTATNLTGLPISTGVSGLGTGVATFLGTPSSANLASAVTDETGSGALVFANSPTLVTPALGTPASATLTNATGLPISTGVSGLGTGVATFLATPSSANLASAVSDETGSGALVFANSPTLVTPALGTPSALVGTNITGTASGLTAGNVTTNANLTGAVTSVGNATSLGSFSSANLLGALTDETGTGSAVFATSPTLVTPILGTPTSATLTNATGLPISTGVSGLGTGIATALAVNTGSAGAPVLFNGALGTPSSGTLTNATGLPNAGLVNSSITIGGTAIALGASSNALANDITVYGVTVGRGLAGNATNTAVGASALGANTTGAYNTVLGYQAGLANTTGNLNIAIGYQAMADGGTITGTENTGIGYISLGKLTSGFNNVGFGNYTLRRNTTGATNTAIGVDALQANTTASNNTAVGYQAGYTNSTGTDLAYFGYLAGYSNTTGGQNTAIGVRALYTNSTGGSNTAVGRQALELNTGDSNTGIGTRALYTNSSGGNNVAVGQQALNSNTTASNNTAVGYQAGYSNTTGYKNTIFGSIAGYSITTGAQNTCIGEYSGQSMTTGNNNTFIGQGAGYLITTGAKNVILGSFYGNQGGLDIRTASNYIVLSDGDGNPRAYWDNVGRYTQTASVSSGTIFDLLNSSATSPFGLTLGFSAAAPNNTSNYFGKFSDTSAERFNFKSNGGLYNYSGNDSNLSDRREKTNFAPAKSYLDVICAIPVQTFNYIDQNLEEDAGLTLGVVAQDVQTLAPELVNESNWGTDEAPKMRLSIYQTDLQYALMKALQELKAEFDAYKSTHP